MRIAFIPRSKSSCARIDACDLVGWRAHMCDADCRCRQHARALHRATPHLRPVHQQHLQALGCAHLRDATAHLPCAHDADDLHGSWHACRFCPSVGVRCRARHACACLHPRAPPRHTPVADGHTASTPWRRDNPASRTQVADRRGAGVRKQHPAFRSRFAALCAVTSA